MVLNEWYSNNWSLNQIENQRYFPKIVIAEKPVKQSLSIQYIIMKLGRIIADIYG